VQLEPEHTIEGDALTASADLLSEEGAITMTRHVIANREMGANNPRPIASSARQKDRFSAIDENSM
jgi:hypothetical protein